MKCEVCLEKLSLYLDNYLGEEEKIEIETHLSQCEECMENYHLLKSCIEIVGSTKEKALPKHFHENLMKKLVLEQSIAIAEPLSSPIEKKKHKKFFPYFSGIAAALFIGVTIVSVNKTGAPFHLNTGNSGIEKASIEAHTEAPMDMPMPMAASMEEQKDTVAAPNVRSRAALESVVVEEWQIVTSNQAIIKEIIETFVATNQLQVELIEETERTLYKITPITEKEKLLTLLEDSKVIESKNIVPADTNELVITVEKK